jgi:hypothetical protein
MNVVGDKFLMKKGSYPQVIIKITHVTNDTGFLEPKSFKLLEE